MPLPCEEICVLLKACFGSHHLASSFISLHCLVNLRPILQFILVSFPYFIENDGFFFFPSTMFFNPFISSSSRYLEREQNANVFIFPSLTKVSVSCSVMPNSLRLHGLQPTRLLCPWDSPVKDTGVHCHFSSPGDLPDSGIEPRSPALQADSLPAELQGNSIFN